MAGPEGAGVSWIVYAVIMLVFISVILLVLQYFGITSKTFGNIDIITAVATAIAILAGVPLAGR